MLFIYERVLFCINIVLKCDKLQKISLYLMQVIPSNNNRYGKRTQEYNREFDGKLIVAVSQYGS